MTFGFGRDPILSLLQTHEHTCTHKHTLTAMHTSWILNRILAPYTCTGWARVQHNTHRGYSWRCRVMLGLNLNLKLWIYSLMLIWTEQVFGMFMLLSYACCQFASATAFVHTLHNAYILISERACKCVCGCGGLLVPAAWRALRSRQTLWVRK